MINNINKAWHEWRVAKLTRAVALQKKCVAVMTPCNVREAHQNLIKRSQDAQIHLLELESVLTHHQDQLKLCSPE